MKVTHDPVGSICIRPLRVITAFASDEKCKQQNAGNADGKAQHIDDGKQFMRGKVAKGDKYVVAQHDYYFSPGYIF